MGVDGIHQLAQGAAQPKGQDHQETEVWRFLEGFCVRVGSLPEVAQLDRLGRQHQVRRAESRGHGVHVGVAEDAARAGSVCSYSVRTSRLAEARV